MTEFEKHCHEIGLMNVQFMPTYAIDDDFNLYKKRDEARRKFSFAILTKQIVDILKQYAPIVEVGSGNGYWAYEFQKAGVDYIGTDLLPNKENYYFQHYYNPWTEIESLSASDAVCKYHDRTLVFCWPSYAEEWATEALKLYKGKYVIYIGEGYGGCTADDEFHDILDNDYNEIDLINIPQWPGLHDRLYIYERKV